MDLQIGRGQFRASAFAVAVLSRFMHVFSAFVLWVSACICSVIRMSFWESHSPSDAPCCLEKTLPIGHFQPRAKPRKGFRGCQTSPAAGQCRALGFLFRFCVCLLIGHGVRFGEARHPGPAACEAMWTLGTFNPSGLTTKTDVVAELPGDFWGITESHLSALGFEKFRKGLQCQKSRYQNLVPGAPCSLRSRSESVGTFSGVLAISPWPTRALHCDIDTPPFRSSRYQVVGSCIHDMWIQIAIIYGYPYSTTHQYPRFQTEQALEEAINRIACQASGPRVIMGDFNWLRPELAQLDRLEAMGFRDLQSLAEQWWGRSPQATGKGSRRIDFVYISPELIPLLRDVRIVDSLWPDHYAVVGSFASPKVSQEAFRWRMPQPVEWPKFNMPFEYPEHPDPTVSYALLWNCIEQQASDWLQSQGQPGLLPSQRGRGQTLEPTRHIDQTVPLRKSRRGEVQPVFHGASICGMRSSSNKFGDCKAFKQPSKSLLWPLGKVSQHCGARFAIPQGFMGVFVVGGSNRYSQSMVGRPFCHWVPQTFMIAVPSFMELMKK